MPPAIDADRIRRLLRHEAVVHSIPGRELMDLGDGLLLHDPSDAEPFWNRLEAVRWQAGMASRLIARADAAPTVRMTGLPSACL